MAAGPCIAPILHFLLLTAAQAVWLPNTTYLPPTFDPSAIKTIIEGLGMVYESHTVITDDGYVVNLNRMISPERYNSHNRGIPVLLVSGLEMQAEAWFTQTVPLSNPPVAWLMAGYDIWVGDARGSIRSRKHRELSILDWRFWDFSFHEIGLYDLPGFIDYILATTGHRKLAYTGFSNGGAYYYVMCSMRPEYQEKLYGGILWAPAGELAQSFGWTWWQQFTLWSYKTAVELEIALGLGAFPLFNDIVRLKLYLLCTVMKSLSIQYISATYGEGCNYDKENFCARVCLTIGGTSAKTFLHTIQLVENGGYFRQFDYGTIENYRKYGQPVPPTYDQSKIHVFTALYYSDNDLFAPAAKVEPFTSRLGGLTYHCKIRGVCHLFYLLDRRVAPYVQDSTQVLISMTDPHRNPYKMHSQKCYIEMP